MKVTYLKKYISILFPYFLTVFLSVSIALLLRLFVVDFYSIPSDSMEPVIEPGDFILVEKLSFGARMYKNFDFLQNDTEPETWRVNGYAPIHAGDVLVFNFPYSRGWNKISMHTSRFYVKRCIGLPGDTLSIRNGYYEINGQRGRGNLEDQETLAGFRGEFSPGIFHTIPFDPAIGWNIVNLGPLYIPAQGDRIKLDSLSCRLYNKMIRYESGKEVRIEDGQIRCDDTLISTYTFRTNWYFMAGDKIWNSQDSRYIGLIPEEFLIGKAVLILTAKDPETGKYRWKRFFTRIQ